MIFYNDNNKNCCDKLQRLIDRGAILSGKISSKDIRDITTVNSFSQCHFFAGIGGWPLAFNLARIPKDANVWSGSCPCQPFSVAGKQKGFEDDRHIWPEFFRLIKISRPTIIFGEQVASRIALQWWDSVAFDLESASYSCATASLCAYAVGRPHQRQRIFWMAYDSNRRCPDWLSAWKQRMEQVRKVEKKPTFKEPCISSELETLWDITGAALPNQPGICPVVDGIPNRLDRLAIAGYGNAIVPELAAKFIIAGLLSILDAVNT